MPPTASVDQRPTMPPAGQPTSGQARRPIGNSRRVWWLLAVALVLNALFFPPLWHLVLRRVFVGQAARHGCLLTIGRMQGGPLDTFRFYDVRCRRPEGGTDVRVARADFTLGWRMPWVEAAVPPAESRLVLSGVSGKWDLATPAGAASEAGPKPARTDTWLARFASWLLPDQIFFQGDDFSLQRHRWQLRLRGLRVSLEHHASGLLLAEEVEIAGPGFANTLLHRHGQTLWDGDRLTLSGLDFGPGVRLVSATLDGAHLDRQRLDWEGDLAVMGGEIRAQGAVNFYHPRLALEVGGSLRRIPVAPLARLLGLTGAAAGTLEQGSFSFRGDPEDWTAAQMWLAAEATDFRWRQRDWQSLELRATVLHQRVQVRRLELQQRSNRVSLSGDFPLLSAAQFSGRWWEAGFACQVDARLEDLHDLAQLFGDRLPELAGRMSVNGSLETTPDRAGIGGYLNVEGTHLEIGNAPLDYLHSTLLFRGSELDVADFQATHAGDYFTGHGSVSLTGPFRYDGELHLAMSDPAPYAPVLDSLLGAALIDGEPTRRDGVFYGPGGDGKTVWLRFDDLLSLPVPFEPR